MCDSPQLMRLTQVNRPLSVRDPWILGSVGGSPFVSGTEGVAGERLRTHKFCRESLG